MKERTWPDPEIRIWYDHEPQGETLKSDFTEESLAIIERLHGKDGPRLVQMLLLPGTIPLEEVKNLPCCSTRSWSLFARAAAWWSRWWRRGGGSG